MKDLLPFWSDLQWKAGTYLIAVFADAGGAVEESDESNNLVLHQYVALDKPRETSLPAPSVAVPKPVLKPAH